MSSIWPSMKIGGKQWQQSTGETSASSAAFRLSTQVGFIPLPASLSTQILPPIISTSRARMVKPNPVSEFSERSVPVGALGAPILREPTKVSNGCQLVTLSFEFLTVSYS